MTTSCYTVELYNNGARGDAHRATFSANGAYDISSYGVNVIVADGKVLVSNDVATTLDMYPAGSSKRWTLGRKWFWELNDKMIDSCTEHQTYTAYNQREQNVKTRNLQALEWLTGLYLGL